MLTKIIEISGVFYSTSIIAEFDEPKLSYGFTNYGWVVTKGNKSFFIKWDSELYIDFLVFLEIPIELLIKKIEIFIILNKLNQKWSNFIPIEKIAHTAFIMESEYWFNLALDFYSESDIYSLDFFYFLNENKKKIWFSQNTKHKIYRILSKYNLK